MESFALISEYINKHVNNPPEKLTMESRLDEVGIDSLALLELVFELEDEHGINVPNDVEMPVTVAQLIELIEKYKPATVK
jgi:acyl carrier protein